MSCRGKFIYLLLVIAATACGGSSSDDSIPDDSVSIEAPQINEPTHLTNTDLIIDTLEEAGSGVIKLMYRDAEVNRSVFHAFENISENSGFVITEDGLAITESKVVTNAMPDTLKLFMANEQTPRNFKILGLFECSNLAIIDIDGENFKHFNWYEKKIDTIQNLSAYALGYRPTSSAPMPDDVYLPDKKHVIISETNLYGVTRFSSLPYLIAYDPPSTLATGGPLIDANARVIGVTCTTYQQPRYQYAVSYEIATPLIDTLKNGTRMDSIGIRGVAQNGQPTFEQYPGKTSPGITVYSVVPGSPADIAGIKPFDRIIRLGNLTMTKDVTFGDYCTVLGETSDDSILDIQILRLNENQKEFEVFEGQINGAALETNADYIAYRTITDSSDQLQAEVPYFWNDLENGNWRFHEEIVGKFVAAATFVEEFMEGWAAPGLFFAMSNNLEHFGVTDESQLLDVYDPWNLKDNCSDSGRNVFDNGRLNGYIDEYTNCLDLDITAFQISASPESEEYMIYAIIYFAFNYDQKILDRILNSFTVIAGQTTL